jgi:hypothetical protein
MLLPEDVDVAAACPDERRRLVAELLGEVVRLRDENAALREEIARLKGHKGRPKIKPSGMERATPGPARRAKSKRSKRRTIAKRVVHEERVLALSAPAGSRFKGYEDFVVQDLRLEARVIRYRRQRWLTPDGRTLVAPLPAGVQGHFGPELRRFSLPSGRRSRTRGCCCSITRARSRPSGSRRFLPAWAWRSRSVRWCGS